jgi:GNAT superfamily N-acetyltransferase
VSPGAARRRATRLLPPAHTPGWLKPALLGDARAIAALRAAAGTHLVERFGPGPWAGRPSERSVRFEMTRGVVYIAREDARPIATLTLSRRKPWAIDLAYFAAARAPLYLTAMAIAPELQRRGLGRRCLEAVDAIARDWGADAVRLDAYDSAAGAGGFYAACGWRETGRAHYRGTPLRYFERRPA